jgi:N utilization substance protein B
MTEAAAKKPAPSRRHITRQFAVQAIYQHLLSGTTPEDIVLQFHEQDGFRRCDRDYFDMLLRGALGHRADLEAAFAGDLDRPVNELDPVEHAVLLVATYELLHCPELPYRVAINEAVELAKLYGAEDGHKYINGVMDRLAHRLRVKETGAGL